MLEELKQKIYDYLATQVNDFNTAIGGRLYYAENDAASPVYPYSVYQFIGGDSDRDTGSRFESPIVQVTIYDNSSSSLLATQIGKKLDTRFDESEGSITLTDYYVLGIDRISPPRETKTFQGDWQWSADYKIQIQTK